MFLPILAVVGVIITAYSGLPYIKAILRGQVRPRLVSWGVWTVLGALMTVAALREQQYPSALLSAVVVAICGTIVVIGWRRGSRDMTTIDKICMAGAAVGIGVYLVLDDPTAAVAVSVAVDAVAFIPTLIHGWTDPDEESLLCFALSTLGAVLVLSTTLAGSATLAGLLYPLYAVSFNGVMAALLVIARNQRMNMQYQSDEA